MDNALTTPETNRLLELARAQVMRPRLASFGTLKMKNAKNKTKGVEKGEFYIERWNPETEEKDIVPIGQHPEIVILVRRYSYSYYDEDLEELAAWTNELDTFRDSQTVHLAEKAPDGVKTQTWNYPAFKAWKEGSELGQKLGFTNILYVLIGDPKPENVCRLFVRNASITGVVDGEKTGDYKHPLPQSFLDFEKPLSFSGTSYPEVVCELGSKWLDANEYFLMTFTNKGNNPKINETMELYGNLLKELQAKYMQDWGAQSIEPKAELVQKIKVEDLPF